MELEPDASCLLNRRRKEKKYFLLLTNTALTLYEVVHFEYLLPLSPDL